MSSQPTPQPNSPLSSDEPKVVSANGAPAAEPTFEERAQVFWIENKKTILLTCALALAILVGKELVLRYLEQRERATGAEFAAAENDAAKLRAFTAAHADHRLAGLAWLALGDLAFKEGKYAEAVAAYGKAAPLTADTVFGGRALIGQAFCQSLGGEKAKAEESFKAVVANLKLSSALRAEAKYHLAVLAVEGGRIDDARKALGELETIDVTGTWGQRASLLRMSLPPVAATAEPAAPAAGGELKLDLPGVK